MSAQVTPSTGTLVVPTARLAAALRRQDACRHRATDAGAWQPREVLGLGGWLTRTSLAARCDGRLPDFPLLGQEQAQALWAAVITEHAIDETGRALDLRPTQTEALARLMVDAEEVVFAWQLHDAWQAPLPLTLEQTLARTWHRRFRERCGELGVSTRARLLEACAARGVVLTAAGASSRGFENAGPALRDLLPPGRSAAAHPGTPTDPTGSSNDAMQHARPSRHHGTPIEFGRHYGTPTLRVYARVEDECDAALEWAHAMRDAGGEGGVALVCLDTRSVDVLLTRARRWQLTTDLAPGAPAVLNAPLARLPTAPLVEQALLSLQCATRLTPADAIALLTSPFIAGWRTEFGPRARLAARILAERSAALAFTDLPGLAERGQCPVLSAVLTGLQALLPATRAPRTSSGWVKFVGQWLAAWGWPGHEGLTAQEQAAHDAWWRALDAIGTLDLVLPRAHYGVLLARLRQVVRGISDSERLAPDAIDVVGLEEAAVLQPAAVWVLGLHDAAWPAVPASNPLLPPALLKRAGVPGSDIAADARHAQRLLETLRQTAQTAVLSHARHDGDTPRRPGGGFAWPTTDVTPAPSLFARWRPADAPEMLEAMPPEQPVPLSTAAVARQRGGTAILAAQSLCAFRAFALFRLLADDVEEAEPGIAPRLRGEIAHAAMAALWRELRTQTVARALPGAAREAAIARAVAAAIDETLAGRPPFDPRQQALETRRLRRLVAQSMALDLDRPAFEVVAIEAPHRLELGALPLTLRIDRVDRLDDGTELVLDYKTGHVHRKEWATPRPLAPQLLAYALARDAAPLGGIGFVQLRPGDCQLVTEPKAPPGEAASLAALRDAWRLELTRLADAFVAGEADLDPRDGAQTCARCGLQVLCRVHEAPPAAVLEDESDES